MRNLTILLICTFAVVANAKPPQKARAPQEAPVVEKTVPPFYEAAAYVANSHARPLASWPFGLQYMIEKNDPKEKICYGIGALEGAARELYDLIGSGYTAGKPEHMELIRTNSKELARLTKVAGGYCGFDVQGHEWLEGGFLIENKESATTKAQLVETLKKIEFLGKQVWNATNCYTAGGPYCDDIYRK